ncbi:MAG: hypothetical protein IKQ41_09700 [Clostridia bacterium]|nr:hypothetical protein [Clostridia bacterium]
MKRILPLLLSLLLLPLCPALAESVNPFAENPVALTISENPAEDTVTVTGADFAQGAAYLRVKAASQEKLTIRVFADSLEGSPFATMVFSPATQDYRYKISLSGVHDLYFTFEGSGTFVSWQAFTSQDEIDAAVRAERNTVYEDKVPFAYTKLCEHGGTIDKFVYEAHDYINDNAVYEKTAFVYLPYGYDESETYDLLILCHGIGGSEYEWGMTGEDSRVKRIMDNLIDKGEIRPFIVVTPNGRAGKSSDYSAFYAFDQELRNDLMPALAAAYSVDITDRNRCAMAGLSMGGMQTINLGIGKCLDLFSAFGAFSACPTTNVAALTAAQLTAHPEWPVRWFYNICGTEDNIALASASAAMERLDEMTDQLDESNYIVQLVPGGHDFGVWYLGFYNFARLFGGAED